MVRRRHRLPLPAAIWLLRLDLVGRVLEPRQRPPGSGLRAVVLAIRDARTAAGWAVTDLEKDCGVVFCGPAVGRIEIGIQPVDPDGSGLCGQVPQRQGVPRKLSRRAGHHLSIDQWPPSFPK